jgi:Arc/MetJ-type ribon-helix-helix transcriptional regulator
MGKQETFQITLDEEQVAVLRQRVASGEFPSIDAAIAAALEAFELDLPPIGDVDLDALAEEGLKSGNFLKWDPDAFLAELQARPVKGK